MQHVFVDLREDVLEVLDEARAQDRTDQSAGTAKDGHQNNLARGGPLHTFGTSQRVHRGQKTTCQTGIHARDHKGGQRVGFGVQTGIVHPLSGWI